MMTNKSILFISLLYGILWNKSIAQEIKGDTIFTSYTQEPTLYFPDGITSCSFTNDGANNQFLKKVESSQVSLRARIKNPQPAILKITEGKRNHEFVILYKEELAAAELQYDWEDLKNLKKHAASVQARKSAAAPAPVSSVKTTTKTPDVPVANTNKQVTSAPTPNPDAKRPDAAVNNNKSVTPAPNPVKPKEDSYDDLIKKAHSMFLKKEYAAAKQLYEKARALKPQEKIAKDYIAEIDAIFDKVAAQKAREEEAKQKEQAFTEKKAAADKAFAAKNYEEAKGNYSIALSIKPNDPYCKSRLADVQKKLDAIAANKKNAEIEEDFKKSINTANNAFNKENWEDAKAGYSVAARLKPSDPYPAAQIKAIDKKLSEAARQQEIERIKKEKDAAFNDAIAIGNNAFNGGNYTAAKSEYKKALAIKPDAYAADQLKKIQKIIVDSVKQVNDARLKIEREKQIAANYKLNIEKADKAFEQKNYAGARTAYKQALNFKDEQYPKDKLGQIENILAKIAEENELKRKCSLAVIKGKAALKNSDFAKARIHFEEAAKFRPDEQFAKDQLKIIYNKLDEIAKEKERNDKYDSVMSRAAKALTNQAYKDALANYKEASELKPSEGYPTKMIMYVEGMLLELAEKQKRDEVAQQRKEILVIRERGVRAIMDKNWNTALEGFRKILALNPTPVDKKFAEEKIIAINAAIEKLPRETVKKEPVVVAPKNKREAKRLKILAEKNAANAAAQKKEEQRRAEIKAREMSAAPKQQLTQQTMVEAAKEPTVRNSYQAEPLPYSHNELVKNYPTINFDELPAGQTYDATDRKNRSQNFEISKKVLAEKPQLNFSDSNNSVKLTCQNIYFSNSNAYIKLLIRNFSKTRDFITGALELKVIKKNGVSQPLKQRFISDFPIVMPQKEFGVVYVANAAIPVDKDDILILQVNDRMEKTKLKINIPVDSYISSKKIAKF